MILAKEFPNEKFATKQELFKALRENAEKIISLKCADVIKSCEKENSGVFAFIDNMGGALKGINLKQGYIYPVINTVNYLDSHNDVHIEGLWNKSVREQQGKVYYVADHELKLSSVIAYPKSVNMTLQRIPWGMVGKNYDGETEALIFEINKNDIVNDNVKSAIEEKQGLQNSVRMRYVKIQLAINSTEKEDIEYKKAYDTYSPFIVNKDTLEERGYFWAVTEAKIEKEGSLVLFGSNDATSIMTNEAADGTSLGIEPQKSTQKSMYELILEKL